ncbi:DUF1800 family protein [Parvularcula lutaonensis]|uniref:DUF1800 family protein n=1 Tax=Parvularcula lutaonensis TaxID=491923 RepID=A0ABV7MEQ7_9PROT|nr:DUF1800 family protein [Parvularcula lutaonensis]GGY54097.1 hypothetical protein GCM10007148_24500 [Parvularcula lutaonensis]
MVTKYVIEDYLGDLSVHVLEPVRDPDLPGRDFLVNADVACENYAREVMQLFTIGIDEIGSGLRPTDTYSYDLTKLSAVFKGLTWKPLSSTFPTTGPSSDGSTSKSRETLLRGASRAALGTPRPTPEQPPIKPRRKPSEAASTRSSSSP